MTIKKEILINLSKTKGLMDSTIGKLKILAGKGEKVFNKRNSAPPKNNPKICVVYLASPTKDLHSEGFMGHKGQVRKFEILLESIQTTVEYLPPYPIVIFHEDFTKQDFSKVKQTAKGREVTFVKVDFKTYKGKKDFGNKFESISGFVEGRPFGYRMMCRFFCGVLQNHPALKGFDYYIRMDHDSFFIEPKKLDVLDCIKRTNFDYLYRTIYTDRKETGAMWEFTKNYAKRKGLSLDGFMKLGLLDKKGNFNGLCPYNNFHISKIAFWKRKDVKDYLKEMEAVDGIIVRHWQDSSIHALLFGLFNPVILEKTDFGYKHNVHHSVIGSLKIIIKNCK